MKIKKVRRKKKLFFRIFLIILLYVVVHVTYIFATGNTARRVAVYSWNVERVEHNEFKKVSKELKINSFYQYMPTEQINKNNNFSELVNFLETIDVDTYLLCGSFEYGYDDEIVKIKQIIDEVAEYNSNNEIKLKGIVLDAEFYLDSRYTEATKQECFEIYYKNMKKAYEYSKERNVEFILVLPYWIDSEFSEESLEKLIKNACDSIEVMNYYKSKSFEHLKSEVEFARRYDKSIVTISELQREDESNSITEKITFYKDGLSASRNDMIKILKEYKYDKLGYAYHYYEYLIELYNNENM